MRRTAFLLLLPLLPAPAAEIPLDARRSGYDFMGAATRAMQDDDASNPGMLWVLEGEGLWQRPGGRAGKSCADCHGDAARSMKGVAARHPAFDAATGRPATLEQRIGACRVSRQGAAGLADESRERLALAAYVAHQSRGLPIEAGGDPRLRPFIEAGRALYHRRQGQVDIACAQCHDERWGRRLAGNPISQGHPTAFPAYRLEWQDLGSTARRVRACMASLRAEPYDYGSEELVNLELYLMWRARGMTMETPGVRP